MNSYSEILKTISTYFKDISHKEDEIRSILNYFRKSYNVQIDHMTHLENLYEELLITSKEFNILIISKSSDLRKYHDFYRLFVDKYNLIREFINLYY